MAAELSADGILLKYYADNRVAIDVMCDPEALFALTYIRHKDGATTDEFSRLIGWDMDRVSAVCDRLRRCGLLKTSNDGEKSGDKLELTQAAHDIATMFANSSVE